jgi:uncharacterized protein involved in outer membrane biogenesis
MDVREILRTRLFRIGAITVAVIGLYALFGFVFAPKIVRSEAIKYVHDTYGRELTIGQVRIQPFWLQLEIRDLSFPDADGKPMLSFRRLFVDFEVSSLWHLAYVFKELTVESPGIRTVVRPDGVVNLADLAPKPKTPPPPEEKKSGLTPLWIQSLVVSNGSLEYEDQSRRVPYSNVFHPVSFTLKDFRTTPQGGGFSLSAESEAHEHFAWSGRFELAPRIGSQGDITIGALLAADVAKFLGDALPFGVSAGSIDLNGHYEVSVGEQLDLKLQLPKLALSGLALRARGGDADWIRVPSLELSQVAVALPEQSAKIEALTVSKLSAQCWLNPDGSVNLTQLFSPSPANSPPPAPKPESPPKPAAPAAPAKPWTLLLQRFDLKAAAVAVEDRMKAPVKKFAIDPVNLHVENVSLDLAKPLPVQLDATINAKALWKISGTLAPSPLVADLQVSLEKSSLKYIQPYLLPVADLTIHDGWLNFGGKLQLRPAGRHEPQFSFDGQVSVDHFKSTDNTLNQDFVNFDLLQFQKLRYTLGPDSLKIDRILVRGPYARVILSKEQILNIKAVMDPQGAAAQLKNWRERQARLASETPAQKRAREKAEAAQAEAAKKQQEQEKAQAKEQEAQQAAATSRAPVAPEVTPLPIRIRELKVETGQMFFSDYTVPPDFNAKIQDLKGTVEGLSSARDAHAKVSLTGNLGEFSPVTISGEVQPFDFEHYTDIGFNFENIALPVFNPYSGKFAGYSIANGKLFTQMHYLIQDKALNATHKIRIEHLEWGQATATKGEAGLPVKFATWLLRDSDGNINLDVPVTGTLDDPKFRVGPIVWQIIKNLIVRAVSAPFKFLGSLFKGAEEAQFVGFAPGSAELDPKSAGALGTLAKALVQKPGIRLEVPAATIAELDRPALIDQLYQQQLDAVMKEQLHRRADDASPLPPLSTLKPKQQIDILSAVVKKQTGSAPNIPEPPAPAAGTSRAEAKASAQAAAIDDLQKAAHGNLTASDQDLEALGLARSSAVQHALLTDTGLEPSRVFVTKKGKVSANEGKVRLELSMQ